MTRDGGHLDESWETPVVGSPLHDTPPTSADVHLYTDTDTFDRQTPMLYAGCEGLHAGEETPYAITSAKGKLEQETKRVVAKAPGLQRRLEWATTSSKQTRHFAVRELYPRLLYTFSDVVCFVLRNTA